MIEVQMPALQFELATTELSEWSGECLVVGCAPDVPAALLEREPALADIIAEMEFKGKPNSTIATRLGGSIRKLVLVGLGETPSLETLRRAVGQGLKQANALKAKTATLAFAEISSASASLTAIAEAALLAAHRDTRFKSKADENGKGFGIETVTVLGLGTDANPIAIATEIASGTLLARELVAAPANVVTPAVLAETAKTIAHDYGLECTILDQAECEKLGMGAFLGVAQASDLPSYFIHIAHKPANPSRKLALVGKGLTFDSGGLNIKTGASSIAMMKIDMAGAAAVLGAMRVIASLKPNVEVHAIVGATENMISGKAMHPGDILTASNGKTIEINNTDAEGRLVLADALVYTDKLGVDAMVDLATLTGACIVALGNDIAGLFTAETSLREQLQTASENTGEKLWPMPLEDSYGDSLNSVVADMKNTGAREGGSISAAIFLKRFVDKTPWAHIDLAGPVWSEKEGAYTSKGATGYGVRLLVDWVMA